MDVKANSPMSNKTAAATIGADRRKENFAALSLSIFKLLAIVIVIPERETPGKAAAIACDIPIKIDCFKLISLYVNWLLAFLQMKSTKIVKKQMKIQYNKVFLLSFFYKKSVGV